MSDQMEFRSAHGRRESSYDDGKRSLGHHRHQCPHTALLRRDRSACADTKSEAGYRLYDDEALERLRQILFFREFDISLKEIRAVMENPAFDRNEILQMQRRMLVRKKERLERLITSIDKILKGEDKMDFEVFDRSEIEEIWDSMYENCSEAQRAIFIAHYGSKETWRKQFWRVRRRMRRRRILLRS